MLFRITVSVHECHLFTSSELAIVHNHHNNSWLNLVCINTSHIGFINYTDLWTFRSSEAWLLKLCCCEAPCYEEKWCGLVGRSLQ
uniref:Uncharacterized protein n=1 Tax=Arundo donax TaxID=35708 RepID=A0A0A8XS14_ARUDO